MPDFQVGDRVRVLIYKDTYGVIENTCFEVTVDGEPVTS
jgi:hypothetical protein